jgi:ATP-dependent Clp protease ATP-binding subunit ClpA
MVKCSKCKKRYAVVFVTKLEDGEKKTEGLCLQCARELGVPVDDIMGDQLKKLGISPDQLEELEQNMAELAETDALSPDLADDDNPALPDDGGAPSLNIQKIISEAFGNTSGNEVSPNSGGESNDKNKKKKEDHKPKREILDRYCKNLTDMARKGRLDKIIGRNNELARVIQILCRRQKNNPCLIGEPGVGKTAIAEALAQRIASGDVPYRLKNTELYLVDLTALVAGTQFRGQFEQRMLGLINEVKAAGNIILVIDEVHSIVGTGGGEGSTNAANIMKPALSRGEIRVIGATTLNEYRKYIEKDSALERRFQPVTVNEPSVEEAAKMLEGVKRYYEEFHRIRVPESVILRTVMLSERYITDRFLPDKAIDLLDEAAASLSLSSSAINESFEIRDELLKLKEEREDAETATEKNEEKKYERIANIKSREIGLSERLNALESECAQVVLTIEDVASVIETWTGIPATTIKENEFLHIDKLEQRLKSRIVGQDKAVEAVARAIKRNRAGITYKRKPVSFIFAGPTGVGKTELVKVLAADLFNTPETLIRFDMSEFMEKHSVSRLIGSPPGYVGYEEAGQLTEKIRRRPYSVVLFDEIEKAHPDVLNVLLQILDDGRVTDAQGRSVNFENVVLVMTTNAGSGNSSSALGFTASKDEAEKNRTEKALMEFLRPEFLNRVDEIIVFNSLTEDNFASIVEIMLSDLESILKERNIALSYTNAAAKLIARESFSVKYGARNMRRYIQRNVEDPIAEAIVSDIAGTLSKVDVSVKDGCLSVVVK